MQLADLNRKYQHFAPMQQVIVFFVVPVVIISYIRGYLHFYLNLVLLNFALSAELELVERHFLTFVLHLNVLSCKARSSLPHVINLIQN